MFEFDNIHLKNLESFDTEEEKIKLEKWKKKLEKSKDKEEKKKLREKIQKIQLKEEKINYLFRSLNLIKQIEELKKIEENNLELKQNNIEKQDVSEKKEKKRKERPMTENEKSEKKKIISIDNFVQYRQKSNFENLTSLIKIAKESDPQKINTNYFQSCRICGTDYNDLLILKNEGAIVCSKCGNSEKLILNIHGCKNQGGTAISVISTFYAYKPPNHFRDTLKQIQGKEGTVIPREVLNSVYQYFKDAQIFEIDFVTSKLIKDALKSRQLDKYYEHRNKIFYLIVGERIIDFTKQQEEELQAAFESIQESWEKYKPISRKNYPNYAYVLRQLCIVLKYHTSENIKFYKYNKTTNLLDHISLLKSPDKRHKQDLLWYPIAQSKGWNFIKTAF